VVINFAVIPIMNIDNNGLRKTTTIFQKEREREIERRKEKKRKEKKRKEIVFLSFCPINHTSQPRGCVPLVRQ
jgi:hypothetical protein